MDAVGEQRRGDGIAGAALVAGAVEAEADRAGVIDAAAAGDAMGGHSPISFSSASEGFGCPAL